MIVNHRSVQMISGSSAIAKLTFHLEDSALYTRLRLLAQETGPARSGANFRSFSASQSNERSQRFDPQEHRGERKARTATGRHKVISSASREPRSILVRDPSTRPSSCRRHKVKSAPQFQDGPFMSSVDRARVDESNH